MVNLLRLLAQIITEQKLIQVVQLQQKLMLKNKNHQQSVYRKYILHIIQVGKSIKALEKRKNNEI